MKPEQIQVAWQEAEKQIGDIVYQYNLASEQLTKECLTQAIVQAIKAGDFLKLVRNTDNAMTVIYLPFQREQQLEFQVENLQKQNAELREGLKEIEQLVVGLRESL